MKDIRGNEIKKEKLTTAEVISIAQCLNLAVEIEPQSDDARLKVLTKRMHKIKTELEKEFLAGNGKFNSQ